MSLIRSPEDAERAALKWMLDNGYPDSLLTSAGADGGVDVRSGSAVAQVKAEMKPIGRPTVQQLAGIGAVEKSKCLFFSLSGFTDEAVEWANNADVALFQFDLQGDPEPLNESASDVVLDATLLAGRTVSEDWKIFVETFDAFWAGDAPAEINGSGISSLGSVEVDLNAFDEDPQSGRVLLQFSVPRSLWSERIEDTPFVRGALVSDDPDFPYVGMARPRLRSAVELTAFLEWVFTGLSIDPSTVSFSVVSKEQSKIKLLTGMVKHSAPDGQVIQSAEMADFESSQEIQREFQKAADRGWRSKLAAARKPDEYADIQDGELGSVGFTIELKWDDSVRGTRDRPWISLQWTVDKHPGPDIPPRGFKGEYLSGYESYFFWKHEFQFGVDVLSGRIDETLEALGLGLSDFLMAHGHQEEDRP